MPKSRTRVRTALFLAYVAPVFILPPYSSLLPSVFFALVACAARTSTLHAAILVRTAHATAAVLYTSARSKDCVCLHLVCCATSSSLEKIISRFLSDYAIWPIIRRCRAGHGAQ